MRYRTIVVDPPWDHSDGTGVHADTGRVTHLPYGTMTNDQIKALPVRGLAEPGAHLYLWTTQRYLRQSYEVAEAWGFSPSIVLVWCKPSRGWSVGATFQSNVEFCLTARAAKSRGGVQLGEYIDAARRAAAIPGKQINAHFGFRGGMASNWMLGYSVPTVEQYNELKCLLGLGDEMDDLVVALNEAKNEPRRQIADSQWFKWPRTAHSQKPDAFIDLVEQVSPGPYAELFARRARFGWDYPIGDQSLGGSTLHGL